MIQGRFCHVLEKISLNSPPFSNITVTLRLGCRVRVKSPIRGTPFSTKPAPDADDKLSVVEIPVGGSSKSSSRQRTTYERDGCKWRTTSLAERDEIESRTVPSLQNQLYDHVVRHFLPANYPESVSPSYKRYALAAFGAAVAGSAGMVLSTQTLLLAIGIVGGKHVNENSTSNQSDSEIDDGSVQNAAILAGALNWVLKDGIGQAGGILFASRMAQEGRLSFDVHPKYWRLVAAIALDVAAAMEILSPLVPTSAVLPIACAANVLKNIAFLTTSATKAALHQSMALTGNLGDITAKSASQAMAAGLIGTSLGIGVSWTLGQQDLSLYMAAFAGLSLIHQTCTWISVRSVALPNFRSDPQRLDFVLSEFLSTGRVVTPQEYAASESVLPFMTRWTPGTKHHSNTKLNSWLSVGSTIDKLCPGGPLEFKQLQDRVPQGTNYLINICNSRVHLTFFETANGEDCLKGMYHVYVLRNELVAHDLDAKENEKCMSASNEKVQSSFPRLLEKLQKAGWLTEAENVQVEPTFAVRLAYN